VDLLKAGAGFHVVLGTQLYIKARTDKDLSKHPTGGHKKVHEASLGWLQLPPAV
jgi:hypothetical protein